jgi:hypothetical protein
MYVGGGSSDICSELIFERVGINKPEAFDDVKVLGRPARCCRVSGLRPHARADARDDDGDRDASA